MYDTEQNHVSGHEAVPVRPDRVATGGHHAAPADMRLATRQRQAAAALADASPRLAAQRRLADVANPTRGDGAPSGRAGSPLPTRLRAGMESLSGMSMELVSVHYNSSRPAQLNAHAYAQGAEIHLAPGQERHLPHEAWHVVQQAQGRVRPTLRSGAGVPINDDASLEHEADTMGDRALHSVAPDGPAVQRKMLSPGASGIVQRYRTHFVPNLDGLDVPESKHDTTPYHAGDLKERPKGWYEGTFDALAKKGTRHVERMGPPINQTMVFYRCERTKTWITYEGIDAGHIQNWKPYVEATKPDTMREAINAYNDLDNLQIESATANRSHDFETDAKGHYKHTKDEASEMQDTGVDLDAYDLDDDFIDDETDPMEEVIVVKIANILLTDAGGINSGARMEKIPGLTVVRTTGTSKGRYVEVEVLASEAEETGIVGQTLWGNSRQLKRGTVKVF